MFSFIQIPSQDVIGMTRRCPYTEVPDMLTELAIFAATNKIPIVGDPIYICHEISINDTKRSTQTGNATVEVARPVGAEVSPPGDISYYELKGGMMAKAVHTWPYEQLAGVVEELFAWIKTQDKKIVGYRREVYRTDITAGSTKSSLTDIYIPVLDKAQTTYTQKKS